MKVSKSEVNYRRASGEKRCENCSMVRLRALAREGSCTHVAGLIHADDTCDDWRRVHRRPKVES